AFQNSFSVTFHGRLLNLMPEILSYLIVTECRGRLLRVLLDFPRPPACSSRPRCHGFPVVAGPVHAARVDARVPRRRPAGELRPHALALLPSIGCFTTNM